MKRYTVCIGEYSYKTEYRPEKRHPGLMAIGYSRAVLADCRVEAVKKCLPDIAREFPKLDGKYLSVFVGEKHNVSALPSRLHPIQIVIETGELRTVR